MAIYPNEIAELFNISERTARRRVQFVREHFGKKRGSPVSFIEFCEYYNVDLDQLISSHEMLVRRRKKK